MSMWTVLMIVAIVLIAIIPSFKDRVLPVKKLMITPAVFMYLFYQTVNDNFSVHFSNSLIMIFGLVVGIAIGALMRRKTAIKSDKNKLLIWIPGSYLSLGIFVLIFSAHFIIGYLQSLDPTYLMQSSIGEQMLLFALSCTSSITIGANAVLYFKYFTSEPSELTFVKKRVNAFIKNG